MPVELSGYPTGLLDLVGSNNRGEAPRLFNDLVTPVVDVGPLYLLSKRVTAVRQTFNLANGFNGANDLAVPAGEVWQLQALSLFITTPAGSTVDMQGMILADGNGLAIGPRVSVAAGQFQGVIAETVPLWLKAGDRITAYAQNVVAGPPTCAIIAMVAKLRA